MTCPAGALAAGAPAHLHRDLRADPGRRRRRRGRQHRDRVRHAADRPAGHRRRQHVDPGHPHPPRSTLDKQAGAINDLDANGHDVGDTIAYTFMVTNTGNVTLNPVTVSDPKVGAVACPPGDPGTGCPAHLHRDLRADPGRRRRRQSSTTPRPPRARRRPARRSPTTTAPAPRSPGRPRSPWTSRPGPPTDLDANGADAGDTIAYTLHRHQHRQRHPEPRHRVTTRRSVPSPARPAPWRRVPSAPAPRRYVLTQVDVDAGHVANTATATGTPPARRHSPDSDDDTDTPIPSAGLDRPGQAGGRDQRPRRQRPSDVGDTITYTFIVTNTGNVTLDPASRLRPEGRRGDLPRRPARCRRAAHLHRDLHADPGRRRRRRRSTTPPPRRAPRRPARRSPTPTTPPPRSPARSGDQPGQAGRHRSTTSTPTADDAGDTIAYTFIVTNTGNVTLDPVGVNDPKVGAVSCPPGHAGTGRVERPAPRPTRSPRPTSTPASVDNTATASRHAADRRRRSTSTPDTTTHADHPHRRRSPLDKQAGTADDVDGNGGVDAGDTIAYTLRGHQHRQRHARPGQRSTTRRSVR